MITIPKIIATIIVLVSLVLFVRAAIRGYREYKALRKEVEEIRARIAERNRRVDGTEYYRKNIHSEAR